MQLKSGTEEIVQWVNNLRWTLWDHWEEGSMLESIMPELGKLKRSLRLTGYPALSVSETKEGSSWLTCSHTSTRTWTQPPHTNTYTHEDIQHTHMPHRNTYVHTGAYIPYTGAYANTYTWAHAHTAQMKNKAFLTVHRPHLLMSPKYLHMGSGGSFLCSLPALFLGVLFSFS